MGIHLHRNGYMSSALVQGILRARFADAQPLDRMVDILELNVLDKAEKWSTTSVQANHIG